jgi:N6-L-threonylcarbamoyladenine synthase
MKSEISREFEDAVTDVLVAKTLKAIETYKVKSLILGGGVSGNIHLQKTLKKQVKNIPIHFPTKILSTDNALMIAIAGYFQYKKRGPNKNSRMLKANGNLKLS